MSTTTESSFTLRRHSTYPSTCHPHIRPTLHNAPQCHAPSSERLCITDEASPLALRSTRNRLRTAVRRGASWTAKCHPAPVWSRRWPGLLGSVLSAELSWLLSTRWRLAGGASGRRPSGRTSLRRPGVPGRLPCRPSPSVSTIRCLPIRLPCPGLVVQPSGVQPSSVRSSSSGVRCPPVRCPVIWCPPSARSHPSRPRKPGGGLGDHVGAAGNVDGRDGSSCTWSAVSRVAWSTARVGLGAMLWRWCVSRWGAAVADLAGSGPGAGCDRARPLTGQEEASPT